MTSLRQQLLDLAELLAIVNAPPQPGAQFKDLLKKYTTSVHEAQEEQNQRNSVRELLSTLTTQSEEEAKKQLKEMSDNALKQFCKFHGIKLGKVVKSKRIKGRIIRKKTTAKAGKLATKKKAAQAPRPAQPEIREPDLITPGISTYEATIENVLDMVRKLKSQATL